MGSESYRKVGRGGAGNYYSPQDVEDLQKKVAEDIESQPEAGAELPLADENRPEYIHSGRGGAGNYETPPTLAERQREIDVTPSMRESSVPQGGFYGRGGAGNVRNEENSRHEGLERQSSGAQQLAHEATVRDVEVGLKEPEKAHLNAEKLE
ncbi:MAG: hypothetical protein LQ351_005900 [Letrouitia transgressa]|nr:MAG: hypothetical protein LQ351_005900 [Letrouitia transgressa]